MSEHKRRPKMLMEGELLGRRSLFEEQQRILRKNEDAKKLYHYLMMRRGRASEKQILEESRWPRKRLERVARQLEKFKLAKAEGKILEWLPEATPIAAIARKHVIKMHAVKAVGQLQKRRYSKAA